MADVTFGARIFHPGFPNGLISHCYLRPLRPCVKRRPATGRSTVGRPRTRISRVAILLRLFWNFPSASPVCLQTVSHLQPPRASRSSKRSTLSAKPVLLFAGTGGALFRGARAAGRGGLTRPGRCWRRSSPRSPSAGSTSGISSSLAQTGVAFRRMEYALAQTGVAFRRMEYA